MTVTLTLMSAATHWAIGNFLWNANAVEGSPYRFVLLVFASWRLAYMLVQEDGPFGLFVGLRWLRGVREIGPGVITSPRYTAWACVFCMTMWTAFWLMLLPFVTSIVLGIAGAAFMLMKWSGLRSGH